MKPLQLVTGALLFGSVLSCGSSSGASAPRADQAGTGGDANTEAGGGSGGTAGSTTGAGGSNNTSGAGGTNNTSGAGGSAANLCPDTSPPPDGRELCRSVEDCPLPNMLCQRDPYPPGLCGACFPTVRECELDTECPGTTVCTIGPYEPCQCMGPGTQCTPACTTESCADDERCNAAGHCEPLPCDEGYTCSPDRVCAPERPQLDQHGCAPAVCNQDGYECPTGSTCEPGAGASPNGCRPIRCDAGYECPVNTDCNPESPSPHGCEQKSCAADSDCDCGACVMGRCEPRLFICEYPAPG